MSRRTGTGGWVTGLVESTRRIVVFGRRGHAADGTAAIARKPKRSATRKTGTKRGNAPLTRRVAQVRKLAATGLDRREIARRTRLSQDTVAMLLNLSTPAPAESAGRGTFFRIFQARMAA